MRRRLCALGIAGLLSTLAACSGGGHKPANPPATPGPNPDIIPAVITPAYVNAVFRVLNHINGNAVRLIATEHRVSTPAQAELRAIFNDPEYATQLQAAQLSIQQGVIANVNPTGADAVTTVKQLIAVSPNCLFVETTTDLSALLRNPTPVAASEYYELARKQRGDDPTGINSTPWAISFNAAFQTPTAIGPRCGTS